MLPGRHLLLPFLGASFAAHLALLLYPAEAPAPVNRSRGDAGLQVTLARSVAGARTATDAPAAVSAVRPRPETPSERPAPPAPRQQAAAATARRSPPPAQPPAVTSPADAADARLTRNATAEAPDAGVTRVAAGAALLTSLRDAMQPHFHYPLLARRRGWEGTVRVGLHISANGEISRLRVVETSRHAVLDRAAIDCLSKLRRMPGAVAWLDGHDSDIVLPVEYRLTDG